jgi:hypothetical protein
MFQKLIRLINRQLNRSTVSNKVFCIGLHKTGTSTLSSWIKEYGFYPTHTTDWQNSKEKLAMYDFFSDGGSHFDYQNEFDFEALHRQYPRAKFILQTRNTRSWVISKLKHAGWKADTAIQPDNPDMIVHDSWTYKSLLTVEKFIAHKLNYEQKVRDYFATHAPDSFIETDITDIGKQEINLEKLRKFLQLRSVNKITLPHANRAKTREALPDSIMNLIDLKTSI